MELFQSISGSQSAFVTDGEGGGKGSIYRVSQESVLVFHLSNSRNT